jgi:CP family cyanate transporter-like MFS transporter
MEKLSSFYKYVRHTPKGLLVVGIFLIGFILRGPAAAVAPIASTLQGTFQIDNATVGLLSGIPVFCFALFSPLAAAIISRRGLEFTFIASISVIFCGIVLRSFGGFTLMLVATVIVGLGVAFGNISIPLIAARDFPKRFAIVTGLASATMNLGNVAAMSLTVPITNLVGFRLALASWALISLAILGVWVLYIFRKQRGKSRKQFELDGIDWHERKKELKRTRKAALLASKLGAENYSCIDDSAQTGDVVKSADPVQKSRNIWKMPFTYGICVVFICQCFAFFSLTAWLPSIFESFNMDTTFAGIASSFFQLFGIIGSVSVAGLVKRFDFTKSFAIIAIFWATLPFGLLIAPQFWFIFMVLAGFAQGANYILMFTKIADYAKTTKETQNLSAATQMSAYFVAGVSPSILGAVHQSVNNWQLPLTMVAICMSIMLVVGILTYYKSRN